MKIALFLILLSVTASAESLSGKWKLDSCRVLQGSEPCRTNIESIELKIGQDPLKVCSQVSFSDITPQQVHCVEAYDNSQYKNDPLKAIVDKREITVSEKQMWDVVTKQSRGERKVETVTFSTNENVLAMYHRIFYYTYNKSTNTWKQTSQWRKEYFFYSSK